MTKKNLIIGTDCSGIEAPIQALIQMNKKFTQEFASDIDHKCQLTSENNYPKPKTFYNNITTRDHKLLKKNIDLYVCGFPCQPFSTAGLQLGNLDPRSNVLSHCIKTIKSSSPKIFILENVKQFKGIKNGEVFNNTIKKLESIMYNKYGYNIITQVLNAKNYGIPQNRERLFIIGIREDIQIKEFETPPLLKMISISSILRNNYTKNIIPPSIKKVYNNHSHKININKPIILSTGSFGTASNISPTLTHSHKHYIYKQKRYMSPQEALLLQGFPHDFKQVVSDTDLYKQVGNSMCVNVLKSLLKELFRITDF